MNTRLTNPQTLLAEIHRRFQTGPITLSAETSRLYHIFGAAAGVPSQQPAELYARNTGKQLLDLKDSFGFEEANIIRDEVLNAFWAALGRPDDEETTRTLDAFWSVLNRPDGEEAWEAMLKVAKAALEADQRQSS